MSILDACRRSYAQAIVDLAALPSGKALLREVIIKCRENSMAGSNPRRVLFVQASEADNENRFTWINGAECSITLEWDGANHVFDNWILIVRNQTTRNFDLISVQVPPSIVLAHELGHFLYALETRVPVSGCTLYAQSQKRARREYNNIFSGVVDLKGNKPRTAKKLFVDSWNGGNYVEIVNILPAASMIPELSRLNYSDGIFVGEAVKSTIPANRQPHFSELNGTAVNVYHDGVPAGGFVRFSHRSSIGFETDLSELNANEHSKFFKLIEILLQKIMIVTAGNTEVRRSLRSKSKCLSLNDLPSID
jgi:hypothetical protein